VAIAITVMVAGCTSEASRKMQDMVSFGFSRPGIPPSSL
jgi:hypothetical protein